MTHATPDPSSAASIRAMRQRQADMLGEMVESGMSMARMFARQAQKDPARADELFACYARTLHSVKLSRRMQEETLTKMVRESGAIVHAYDPAPERWAQLFEIMQRLLRADGQHEAADKMKNHGTGDYVFVMPLSELVATLCVGMHVKPDWTRLRWEAWAMDEMLSDKVGKPLAPFIAPVQAELDRAEILEALGDVEDPDELEELLSDLDDEQLAVLDRLLSVGDDLDR